MDNQNKILLNDISKKIFKHRELIQNRFDHVLNAGMLILGSSVSGFEEEFANYIGAQYAIGVANGTDAIELALKAVGVEEGSKVATVANAGGYSTAAIIALGAVPFFMDVSLDTKNVTFDEVNRAIQSGVKFVVVTHLYGEITSEIRKIVDLCRSADVVLIEDCAQAHGARIGNTSAGSFGDISSFSFYPTKNLGCLGDGGLVATSNQDLAYLVKQLRQYGWSNKYRVAVAGGRNSRLDELQAAFLLSFLPFLDEWNNRRREIAIRYVNGIKHPDILCREHFNESSVAHLFVIRCQKRNALQKFLESNNIATDIHYPIPDNLQPAYSASYNNITLINTNQLASEVLTLPCYPELTNEQVDRVIKMVNIWKS